jgi:hypothetical protein
LTAGDPAALEATRERKKTLVAVDFINQAYGLWKNHDPRTCWGSRNGRAKSAGSEPVEFEWVVVARFVQALGLIDFAAFSRLTV